MSDLQPASLVRCRPSRGTHAVSPRTLGSLGDINVFESRRGLVRPCCGEKSTVPRVRGVGREARLPVPTLGRPDGWLADGQRPATMQKPWKVYVGR